MSRAFWLSAWAALWAAFLLPAAAYAGTGNCGQAFVAPAASSFTAGSGNDGTMLSAANATGAAEGWAGASIAVALPTPASVAVGWTMCGASDSNKTAIFEAPQLAAPGTPTLGSTSGGTLAATTYYVKITYVNLAGETVASAESSLAVASDHLLTVATPGASGNATGWNVYAATSSGGETKQTASPLALSANWTEPTGGLISGTSPPSTGTAPSAYLLQGGQALGSLLVGPNNFDFAQVQNDGTNFRVLGASQETGIYNGTSPSGVPSRWERPGGSGYQATSGDNGSVISSALTSAGLTVTLPSTNAIVSGWTITLAADGLSSSTTVNGTAGGAILLPSGTSISTAYVPVGFMADIRFDGSNFRFIPLWSIPPNANDVRIFGAVGDGVTNDTAAIQTAWNLGATYIPAGKWHITNELFCGASSTGYNALLGAGKFIATLTVGNSAGNDFDMSANGVIKYSNPTTVASACSVDGIGIDFYQPDFSGMTISNIIQYPKALDGDGVHYGSLGGGDGIFINAAWECFGASATETGAPGALHIGRIDCSSFGTGFYMEGNDDFVDVDSWDQGQGQLTANQSAVYRAAGEAGTALCIEEAGDVQAINFGYAGCFAQGVTLQNGTAYNTPGAFGTLDLDSDGAVLTVDAGSGGNSVNIGTLYSTKSDADTLGTFNIGGASTVVNISNFRDVSDQTASPDIQLNSGTLTLHGGYYFYSESTNTPILVTGGFLKMEAINFVLPTPATATMMLIPAGDSGTLDLQDNNFNEPNIARSSSDPLIHAAWTGTGSPRLIMTGNSFLGSNVVGNILEIDYDNPANDVQANIFNGWHVDLGFTTYTGYYDLGDVPFPITSTPEFATNGNFAPTGGTTYATFTGNITGCVVTVVSGLSGTISMPQQVEGTGVAANTTIQGGSGVTWQVLPCQTIANESLTTVTPAVVGTYFRRGSWADLHLRDTFNTNTPYSGVSGGFLFQTNAPGVYPFEDPSGVPCTIGNLSNFTYAGTPRALINGGAQIALWNDQSGGIPVAFSTTNVPAGTSGMSADISCRYRTR